MGTTLNEGTEVDSLSMNSASECENLIIFKCYDDFDHDKVIIPQKKRKIRSRKLREIFGNRN